MSRIFVKNLPPYLTDEKLREHFGAKGEVTDAKVMRTRDGLSRQFGFVGFKSDKEAEAAAKYFDRSFVDTFKLSCQIARQVGDPTLGRAWSRHTQTPQPTGANSAPIHNPRFDTSKIAAQAKSAGAGGGKKAGAEGTAADETKTKKKKEMASDAKSKKVAAAGGRQGARAAAAAAGGAAQEGEEEEVDAELAEFLEVMQPRNKRKLWANDTAPAGASAAPQPKGTPGGKQARQSRRDGDEDAGGESDAESEELYEDVGGGGGGDSDSDSDSDLDDGHPAAAAAGGGEPLSHSDYLKTRVRAQWSDDDDDEEEEEGPSGRQNGAAAEGKTGRAKGREGRGEGVAEEGRSDASDIRQAGGEQGAAEGGPSSSRPQRGAHEGGEEEQEEEAESSGRLFVRNLSYTTTEEELRELFAKYGELSEVHLVVDRVTSKSKGFAYVLFMLPQCATQAKKELDMATFQGRLLHILPAQPPPFAAHHAVKEEKTSVMGSRSGYKVEREEQRKAAEMQGATKAWSSFFMRPDTVAHNVALKYGVTKAELLSPAAADLAVRLALGETHIVADTKQALREAGVNVELLEKLARGGGGDGGGRQKGGGGKEGGGGGGGGGGAVKRSARVLLVKNLPFSATAEELAALFGRHGSVGALILPPTRTMALVEYLEPAGAKRAFKELAYKPFQHVPLYLEWAPLGTISESALEGGAEEGAVTDGAAPAPVPVVVGQDDVTRLAVTDKLAPPADDEDDSDTAEARSVFVKNLNFSTTDDVLRRALEQKLPPAAVRNVLIKTKKAGNGKLLSMGFGFVEFDSLERAREACKKLQGLVVEGHALLLQMSKAKQAPAGQQQQKQKQAAPKKDAFSSTKLILRNVAFEATKKDLQQLFNPFGQVKSMRLPKKFDGSHRGFAFVEFVTRQEAQNAFDALQNTHLYGRHLVLERAKESEGVEELRARTAAQFFPDTASAPSKRQKLNAQIEDAMQNFDDMIDL